MPRTFQDGLDYDAENVFFSVDEFAREYTLSRGLNESSGVAAITALRLYERIDNAGGVTEVQSVDFDLPASLYLIDGNQVEPLPGDRFGDGTQVWEVFPIGRRQCFEPTDGDGRVIRVHTRRVVNG